MTDAPDGIVGQLQRQRVKIVATCCNRRFAAQHWWRPTHLAAGAVGAPAGHHFDRDRGRGGGQPDVAGPGELMHSAPTSNDPAATSSLHHQFISRCSAPAEALCPSITQVLGPRCEAIGFSVPDIGLLFGFQSAVYAVSSPLAG